MLRIMTRDKNRAQESDHEIKVTAEKRPVFPTEKRDKQVRGSTKSTPILLDIHNISVLNYQTT